jgi:hypothetical protein
MIEPSSTSWRAAIKRNIAAANDADHWWLSGFVGGYRDWHNHPRNRHHNFSVISLAADGLVRETPDPETYQVYSAETLAAFNALLLQFENAAFAENLAKQYAAARANKGRVWRRAKAKPTKYARDASGVKVPRGKPYVR